MAIFKKIGSFYEGLHLYTPSMGERVKAVLHDGKYRMSAIVGVKHDALVTEEELTSRDARRYARGYQKRAATDLAIAEKYLDIADERQKIEEQDENN